MYLIKKETFMKTKRMNRHYVLIAIALALVISCFAFSVSANDRGEEKAEELSAITASDSKTVLVPGGGYSIIFSSDSNQLDATLSSKLAGELSLSGEFLNVSIDIMEREKNKEILIGNTNRALSSELLAACEAVAKDDSLVWGFAFKDGKFAYTAISEESFDRGSKDFLERFIIDGTFVVPDDLWLIVKFSRAEYDKELKEEEERLEAEKEAERLKKIEEYKKAIADFGFSDFTDHVTLDYTVMPDSVWGKPALYPTDGEHPRLNVTTYMLDDIRTFLNTTDEGSFLYDVLKKMADTNYTGVLDPAREHKSGRIGVHNMDEKGLAIIEARAFMYLLSGDEAYGYHAILAMKNYLKTIDIQHIHSDQCREFGRILYCTAEVYDWCYDLLTDTDMDHFIVAMTDICSSQNDNTDFGNQIEVGYPPSGQGSVSGHGSEHQILRDYLAASIAIFDENPSWYNYVGARVYNDYIATRNYYYQSGTYQQGIFNYGPFRHNADLWSAWILLCATGENPYVDDLQKITNSFFEYEVSDGTFFGTGDGSRPKAASTRWINDSMLVAALYGDKNLKQRVLNYYSNFTSNLFTGASVDMSAAHMLALCTSYYNKTGTTKGIDIHEGKAVINYHSYPIGQMIARSEWDNVAAPAVFMKIGERTTANHEHADAGTFQIFYNGLYSGESGVYDKYGSTHFNYYHQATVAHNGLLIFNPASADTELKGGSVDTATNASKIFYSGGQRKPGETSTLDAWLNNSVYLTGYVMGYEYGFNDDGTADYAYLAGDITPAYTIAQASYVGRRMLAIFTDNEDYPMYFIVYDTIDTASESFVNKFLLHTPTEPVIDEAAKTVTLTDKNGRLVLHSLKGGDKFEALGGAGNNYLINGVQCALSTTGNDKMWGRVEISNTGTTNSEFLSFMYVTGAENDNKLAPSTFENDLLIGTQFDDTVVVFARSEERNTEQLVFTSTGTGINRYFVSGLYEGTWNILVDGVEVAHRVSSVDGGMITFLAPAGTVTVAPGKDIAPSNGGRIIYNAYGGAVPDDAPQVYEIGVPVALPDKIVRGNDEFLGWFTSPNFEEETKITEIVATEKGKFNVYAKYKSYPVLEDYTDRNFAFGESTKNFGGLNYVGKSKTGSYFEVRKDAASGNKYVAISRTVTDMQLDSTSSVSSYIGFETQLTYELDLARDGEKTPISSSFRLRESSNKQVVTLFSTSQEGYVIFGGVTLFELSDTFQKVIITVDFAESTITAYNLFGDVIVTKAFSVPEASTAQSTLEWMSMLSYTFNWWMGGGESILVDNIKVYTGAYDPNNIELPADENRIIYNAGSAIIPSDAPLKYKVGTTVKLPTLKLENGMFIGWYTTKNFEKGTEITEINAENADAPIEVYAKCSQVILDVDFTGTNANVFESNAKIEDLQIQASGKTGSYAKTVTDTLGNTYLEVFTDGMDLSINNYASITSPIMSAGGKITYVLDLATLPDGRCGRTDLRIRASSTTDVVHIFIIDGGKIYLAGDTNSTEIATLSTKFTKVAFTLDFYESTITAYNTYGDVLGTKEIKAPSGTLEEWILTIKNSINWYFSKGGGIAFDNLKIYTGDYIYEEEVIPEGSFKITYATNGGTFDTAKDRYVKADGAFTLPTDIKNGDFKFAGWYTSPNFDESTLVTEITANAGADCTVFARWIGKSFNEDFTGLNGSSIYEKSGALTGTDLTLTATNLIGAGLTVMKDEADNEYLYFTRGGDTNDPQLRYSKGVGVGADSKVTYHISLALPEEGACMNADFRMRCYDADRKFTDILLFSISGGTLRLGGKTEFLALTEEFTDIFVTVSFADGSITAYDKEGTVLAVESHDKDLEWGKSVGVPIYFRAIGGDAIKIDNIWIAPCGFNNALI